MHACMRAKLTREDAKWRRFLGQKTEEANGPDSGNGGRHGLGGRGRSRFRGGVFSLEVLGHEQYVVIVEIGFFVTRVSKLVVCGACAYF